jgi:hypothetical protein
MNQFAVDHLSMIETQIELAKQDPKFHQAATIKECAYAIGCLKARLATEVDEPAISFAMLATDVYDRNWESFWDGLTKATPEEFIAEAEKLQVRARTLRDFFAARLQEKQTST